jgi:glycosyltransferase involved in cell wall biosynthesis
MNDAPPPTDHMDSTELSSAKVGPQAMPRVAIVVGGTIPEQRRREIEERKRPRIDVLELERIHHAALYDFSLISDGVQHKDVAHLVWRITERTHQWSASLAIRVLPRIRDLDVVYATGEDVGFPLAALLRARNMPKPYLVVRLEQPTYGRNLLRKTVYAALLGYAMARVDRLLCRTTAHLQYLHSVMNVPISKLQVVRETTDTRFYHHTAADHAESSPSTRPLIVSAGLEMRDYPTLVEAVRGLPLDLVIGAGSPWSHMSYAHQPAMPLPPNVRVSSFSPVEMRALYAAADVVVVPVKPSLRACGMNVILEAWAMRKPVIATRTVGLLDYVVDGQNGLFVAPYDVEALRWRILQLLEHPERAQQLAHEGQLVVQDDLNLDRYVERISAELAEVGQVGARRR